MSLKVTVSLAHGLHPMVATGTGIKFNDEFVERLYEKDEFFRERIILPINEIAGDQWQVHFDEKEELNRIIFLVDIMADDKYLGQIINIISDAFPEIDLQFWKPGPPYTCLGERRGNAEN